MLKKELIIGVLATSVLLGSFGTALAESSNDKSISNYDYSKECLAVVGTGAGDWEFRSYDQGPVDIASGSR